MTAAEKKDATVEKKPYEKYSSGGGMVQAKDLAALSSWITDLKAEDKFSKYLEENEDGYHSLDQMLGLCAGFDESDDEKKIVELLIKEGAKVDICDKNKETILMRAAANNKVGMMQLLKDNGASLDHVDGSIKRIWHHAATSNAADSLEWLVKNGLNLDKKGLLGRTPYHYAAYSCAELACARLVKLGADPSLEDMEGALPMEMISKGDDWQPLFRMMEHHYKLNKAGVADQAARDNLANGFLGWLKAIGQKVDNTPDVQYSTPEDKEAAEKLKVKTEGVPFGWSAEGNVFGYFVSTESHAFVRSSSGKYYTIKHVDIPETTEWQNDGAMIDEKVLFALPQVIEITQPSAEILRQNILAAMNAAALITVDPAVMDGYIADAINNVSQPAKKAKP